MNQDLSPLRVFDRLSFWSSGTLFIKKEKSKKDLIDELRLLQDLTIYVQKTLKEMTAMLKTVGAMAVLFK